MIGRNERTRVDIEDAIEAGVKGIRRDMRRKKE
jgi:hypothetical protein